MKYVSCFSGIEAASVASQGLGWEPVAFSEIDNFASAVLAHHYPKVPNLGDITKIDWSEYNGRVGLVCGGSPCFTAGHLVLTERGHVPIESVHVGDVVLTHKGNWKRVVRVGGKVAPTFILKGQGHWGIECTDTHPFWAVEKTGKSTRIQGKAVRVVSIGDPSWVKAKEMKGRFWTSHTDYGTPDMPLPMFEGREKDLKLSDSQLAFLAGLYLGDGYLRHNAAKNAHVVMLGVNGKKHSAIEETLPGLFSIAERVGKAVKLRKCSSALYRWLDLNFGQLSVSKELPSWVYQMTEDLRREMLRGYILTDGTPMPNGHRTSTVSKKLAIGIKTLAVSLGYSCTCRFVKNKRTECVIEGRTVNERPYYTVSISDKSSSAFHKNTLLCGLVRSVIPTGEEKQVYNIEVEDDHSYTVDGIIVKNCQAFSVAGLRLSLGDPRGNLTLEYMRAVHAIKPKWVVWEQVPGVFSASGNPFGCFVAGLAGYDSPIEPPNGKWGNSGFLVAKDEGSYSLAWRVLCAQHFGVPQRRRRIFLVGHLGIGCWWKPLEVLLERHCEGRDIAQGRKAREEAAPNAGRGVEAVDGQAVAIGSHWDDLKFPHPTLNQSHNVGGIGASNQELFSQRGGGLVQAVCTGGDVSRTLTSRNDGSPCADRGPETVAIAFAQNQEGELRTSETMSTLGTTQNASGRATGKVCIGIDEEPETFYIKGFKGEQNYASPQERNPHTPLRTLREEIGEEAFTKWGLGILDSFQKTEVLRKALYGKGIRYKAFPRCWMVYNALSRTKSDPAWLLQSLRETECKGCPPQGWRPSEQLAGELGAYLSELSLAGPSEGRFMQDMWNATEGAGPVRYALSTIQEIWGSFNCKDEPAHATTKDGGAPQERKAIVRRITPVEAEFLQKFPRNYTRIPYRGKPAELCPDGPRYKALGNSWAVPVARWVFSRIDKVDNL